MESLDQQGFKLMKIWNQFLEGVPYKGINATYQTPEGQLFELQLHTPASLEMKQVINHPLYEQQRLLPKNDPLYYQLDRQMIQNSATVPVPPVAASIRKPR
jgi:hypothetical protein